MVLWTLHRPGVRHGTAVAGDSFMNRAPPEAMQWPAATSWTLHRPEIRHGTAVVPRCCTAYLAAFVPPESGL